MTEVTMEEAKEDPVPCSICGVPMIVGENVDYRLGNNAWPVNDGRCCDDCNYVRVIPARLAGLNMPS
jgi:hypothetical protein